MATTAEQRRAYGGIPLFGLGFRPFFLFAAVWAASALPLWIASVVGWAPQLTRDWHVHEMLFGYLGGVIAGFLLTAVPNWTGRVPVAGAPLAALFGLWAAGRVLMLAAPDAGVSAAVDTAFLFVLGLIIAREVIAGRNLRNAPVCVLILVLAMANALTHFRAFEAELALLGERIGLGVVAMLVALIGGRITPSFTRNWMAKHAVKPEPASPGRFDLIALAVTAVALLSWIVAPQLQVAGAALTIAGALTAMRLARWQGWRTGAEPLVTILHIGYGWLALALALLGASILAPGVVPPTAGVHALTAGAFGVMTLAVMTRASLGHTGGPLTADRATQAVYLLVNLGAALRVASPFLPQHYAALLVVSGLCWGGAFVLFVAGYGPLLLRARRQA